MGFAQRAALARSYLNGAERGIPGPISVLIETTVRCNLLCPMCPRTIGNYTKGELETDLVMKALDEMAGSDGLVFLYGLGEPLLDPRIFDFIRACGERGLTSLVSTNGLLMDDEAAHGLIDAGLDHLIIGIDGTTQETYGRYREGGDLAVLEQRVERFLAIKQERRARLDVTIQMIRLEKNHHQVDEFLRTWTRPGVNAVRIKEEDIGLEATAGIHRDGDLRKNPSRLLYRGPLVIRHTGEVYACYSGAESFDSLGHIREHTLAELWDSDGLVKLRHLHAQGRSAEIPECARCASPRPRKPFVFGSFLVSSSILRKAIPLLEKAALRHRMPFSEKRRKRF